MVKQIKATPILRGKDAVNFIKKMNENKNRKADIAIVTEIRNEAKQLRTILR